MTICIGALYNTEKNKQGIILCSDARATVPGFAASDRTWKHEFFGHDLRGLISGQLSCGRELASMYRDYIGTRESGIKLEGKDILDHLRVPPRRLKKKLIDEYFQLRWGITHEQFVGGALSTLQASELMRINSEVNAIAFPGETWALIASLATGAPQLFVVDSSGQVCIEDDFAVIGSGYAMARASLCQRRFHGFFPLGQALYMVYEAKRLCEADPNVGPDTVIRILYLGDKGELIDHLVTNHDEDILGEYFRECGPQRLDGVQTPPDLNESVSVKKNEQKTIPESTSSSGSEETQK